ncbi:MAG: LysR family transcriptional regulator [Alphaproteobacteria bacterium]|nr:LysR family transcriptional regulator [Alphaproteobacteria bacterium]
MPQRSTCKLDWNKLRVFHAVAEAGSFTHASESLNLSQSAVSRQISALEESLGVSLFHRHARGLVMTEAGDLLYKTVHDVFAKLNNVESMLTETRENPEGPLRVTTTVAFGSVWLTSRLKEFVRSYPNIEVTLRLDDRELDLAMREADVAIRFSEPTDPNLIKKHGGSMRVMLFASPDYLKERGAPRSFEDLARHELVVFGEGAYPFGQVHWLTEELQRRGVTARIGLRVNNLYGIYRAVRSGIGISALPEYFYREGHGLVHVLPDIEGPEIHGYFVYPEELRNSARVGVFRDYLFREIARAKAQNTVLAEVARPSKSAIA